MRTTAVSSGWRELRLLAVYVSIVCFAITAFFAYAVPFDHFVAMPPDVRFHLIGVQSVLTALLYALDRMLERTSERWVTAYRTAIFAAALVLIARRFEISWPLNALPEHLLSNVSPALPVLSRVTFVLVCVWIATRFHRQIRAAFTYLSVVALAVTLMAFTGTFAPDSIFENYDSATVTRGESSEPPVVVIVFDELSYDALLDESGTIDRERFPNFARLSNESRAFSNATTNYFHTWLALPPMIDAAVALAPQRDVILYEHTVRVERLYAGGCGVEYTCRGAAHVASGRQGEFSRHVTVRALDIAVPEDVASLLGPTLDWVRDWTGTAPAAADPAAVHTFTDAMAERFLGDIRSGDTSGRLYFFHTLLPHGPYMFDRAGDIDSDDLRQFYPDAPGDVASVREAYLSQIEYADTILGQIIGALEDSGSYDDATMLVTADHGARLESPLAVADGGSVDGMMTRVPLFIRGPGIINDWTDADYQHVDFAPTLFDLVRGSVEGAPPSGSELAAVPRASALDEQRPVRSKTFFIDEEGEGYWKYSYEDTAAAWELSASFETPIDDRTLSAGDDAASEH